jgi:hypothetical protein
MVIRKKYYKTRKMESSSKNTEDNGEHKRKLKMDHLMLNLMLESGKKMESNRIKESDGGKGR